MVERELSIELDTGLHARPASLIAEYVKDYSGEVNMVLGDKSGNLKSILNILTLGVSKGSKVLIRVEGEDEERYADSVVDYIRQIEDV